MSKENIIVGLDIGSNLFSFRDPITGEMLVHINEEIDEEAANRIADAGIDRRWLNTFHCPIGLPLGTGRLVVAEPQRLTCFTVADGRWADVQSVRAGGADAWASLALQARSRADEATRSIQHAALG